MGVGEQISCQFLMMRNQKIDVNTGKRLRAGSLMLDGTHSNRKLQVCGLMNGFVDLLDVLDA